VVITGRLSLRDDKEPQVVINRARPISDFENAQPESEIRRSEPAAGAGKLYLRLPTENGKLCAKIRAIVNKFAGDSSVVLYFEDTKQRRGTRCLIMESMLTELKNVLGEANVVLK